MSACQTVMCGGYVVTTQWDPNQNSDSGDDVIVRLSDGARWTLVVMRTPSYREGWNQRGFVAHAQLWQPWMYGAHWGVNYGIQRIAIASLGAPEGP